MAAAKYHHIAMWITQLCDCSMAHLHNNVAATSERHCRMSCMKKIVSVMCCVCTCAHCVHVRARVCVCTSWKLLSNKVH